MQARRTKSTVGSAPNMDGFPSGMDTELWQLSRSDWKTLWSIVTVVFGNFVCTPDGTRIALRPPTWKDSKLLWLRERNLDVILWAVLSILVMLGCWAFLRTAVELVLVAALNPTMHQSFDMVISCVRAALRQVQYETGVSTAAGVTEEEALRCSGGRPVADLFYGFICDEDERASGKQGNDAAYRRARPIAQSLRYASSGKKVHVGQCVADELEFLPCAPHSVL